MRTGRPKVFLSVSAEERETLQRWARRPKTARALALRARIVLRCAEGVGNKVVAVELGITGQTVGKWRSRFIEKRLDGLLDEPRPGAPRRISDQDVDRVLTMTLESTPRDATHWSTRSIAKVLGSPRPQSAGSGVPLRCSPIAVRLSSSPRTLSLSRRCGISPPGTSLIGAAYARRGDARNESPALMAST